MTSQRYHVPVIPGHHIYDSTCEGKSAYAEEWAAIRAARRMMQNDGSSVDNLGVFKCSRCTHWHVGRLSTIERSFRSDMM